MRNDDCMRLSQQSGFEYFARVNQTRRNRTMRNNVVSDYMMLCIKVECDEVFLRVEFQWCDELFEIVGRADWNRLSTGLLDERQSDFRNDMSIFSREKADTD